MIPTIGLNNFVLRQTAASKFSHFDGAWPEVINRVRESWESRTPGYKDGVVLVPVNPSRFMCGIVELSLSTKIRAVYAARREGEAPFVQIEAFGPKTPAAVVEIVLYRSDVLGKDASSECEWEIVSINARCTFHPEPQTPMAMARNFLALEGGTKADYSAEQFAESIHFWSSRAMAAGPEPEIPTENLHRLLRNLGLDPHSQDTSWRVDAIKAFLRDL
jgi:hypothetical protein